MTDDPRTELIAELAVKAAQGRSVKQAGRWAALLGFVLALAVALPVSLVVNAQNAETQRANLEYVCAQQLAAVGIQRQTFEQTVAQNRTNQGLFDPADFGLSQGEWDRLITQGERQDGATLAALEELAAASCSEAIR